MNHSIHSLLFVAAISTTASLTGCSQEANAERSLTSAHEHFADGDYASAEIEYKNTLAAEPGNAEALKHLGIIRVEQGANYEGAGMLTAAKRKLPKDDEIGVHLAQALLSLGFVPDSRGELIDVLDRSPAHAEALMLLAETSVSPEWMTETDQRLAAAGEKTAAVKLATALLELRRENIEEGSSLVDEVLESEPEFARAHALRAGVLISRNQPENALAALEKAADLAGPRSNESIAYARALMASQRRDEAVAYLEQITAATPDFLPAWSTLGQIAASEERDEAASEHFAKVLAKNRFDPATAQMQAEVWMRQGQPEKAAELLGEITTAFPSRPPMELALAKAYLATDKLAQAAAALDRALAVAPQFTEAARLRAQVHLQGGNTTDAITALEEIRAREPGDTAARDLLIAAYRAAGRNQDAITLLREKTDADPEDARSRVELGQLLRAQGDLAGARSLLEGASGTVSDDLAVVTNLAAIDLSEGKGDDALGRIDDYLANHPESSEAHAVKAGIHLGLEQPEAAEQALEKALELKPDNAQAFALLLQMKEKPGQEAEALAIFDRYLDAFPDDPQARLQRGYLLQQLGRPDDARAVLKALIDAEPEFAAAFNNLAALESEAFDDLRTAATHARKARSLDANHPAIADTLGWIEWQLGNYAAALPLLTEAASRMGESPSILYHLGMAHHAMGNSTEAVTALTQALQSGEDFPEKEDARNSLDRLGQVAGMPLDDLQKNADEHPEDVLLRLTLAERLTGEGQPEDALKSFQAALELNPALAAAHAGIARLYAGPLDSPEEALEAASKARELAPRDPRVLAALGAARLRTGATQEAYGLLKDAVARLQNDPEVLAAFARSAYRLGRIGEARDAMTFVASADAPTSPEAERFLRLTADGATSNPEALAEAEQALAEDPDNLPALMIRGAHAANSGEDAAPIYQRALELHPRFDPARVRLAAIYMDDPEKLDQALELARAARTNLPSDPELSGILGIISQRQGDHAYSIQVLKGLASVRPLNASELFALGMSQAAREESEARENLRRAIEAGLSPTEKEQAEKALEEIQEVSGSEEAEDTE